VIVECLDSTIPTIAWSDLEISHAVGSGRNGLVGFVTFKEKSILKEAALKMFDVVKGEGGYSSFEHELKMYQTLSSYQGRIIPRLLFQTTSWSGNVVGLGLELCRPLPHHFSSWTQNQRNQAYQTLQLLASCGLGSALGLAHNDIRPTNFVLSACDQVFVLDFEDTYLICSESQRKSYLSHALVSLESKDSCTGSSGS